MCPIHLPGREKRRLEVPFLRMEPLVQYLANNLEPFLDVPFAFFGHSLGALTAFETAREFRSRGLALPLHLFVSAHAAPQIPRSLSPIHQHSDANFIRELIVRYDAIPAQVLADAQMMELFLPVLRADLEILETYSYLPGAPLACPISALGGVLDSTVTTNEIEAWREQTTSVFQLHMFPGKHFFLKDARPQVLQAICRSLPVRSATS
jgi:medium-chain acyl-[acyl-carrier-protein] hydrolase